MNHALRAIVECPQPHHYRSMRGPPGGVSRTAINHFQSERPATSAPPETPSPAAPVVLSTRASTAPASPSSRPTWLKGTVIPRRQTMHEAAILFVRVLDARPGSQ